MCGSNSLSPSFWILWLGKCTYMRYYGCFSTGVNWVWYIYCPLLMKWLFCFLGSFLFNQNCRRLLFVFLRGTTITVFCLYSFQFIMYVLSVCGVFWRGKYLFLDNGIACLFQSAFSRELGGWRCHTRELFTCSVSHAHANITSKIFAVCNLHVLLLPFMWKC